MSLRVQHEVQANHQKRRAQKNAQIETRALSDRSVSQIATFFPPAGFCLEHVCVRLRRPVAGTDTL